MPLILAALLFLPFAVTGHNGATLAGILLAGAGIATQIIRGDAAPGGVGSEDWYLERPGYEGEVEK